MKQIRLHIGMIAVLLTFMLAACTDCIVDNETSSNEAEDGYYTAHFNVSIPSFEQQVTRSTLFTNEGIGKNCVKLFCFDEEGQFVGFGKVGEFGEIKGFRRDVDGNIIQNGDKDIASIWWQIQKASTRPSTGKTSQNGWVCTRIY